MSYSREIAQAIVAILDEKDFRYSFDQEKGIIQYILHIKSKIRYVNYTIRVRDDAFTVYAYSPINADNEDTDQITRVAEFICRANYGLVNGNFELDFNDGEIRYKCHVDCEGDNDDIAYTSEIMKTAMQLPANMFKTYGDGLLDVIFSGEKAKEAVDRCENRGRSGGSGDAPSASDIEELLRRLAEAGGSDGSES